MIHEVIVTTISKNNIIHIAPMGIKIIENNIIISPFRPSQTLDNLVFNNKATINFTDDVRVFAGIVTKIKKDWRTIGYDTDENVPHLAETNTHYCVEAKEFMDDEKRPNIICDIIDQKTHRPFMGFNRAQFSVIEASVLVSRLGMISIEKIIQEIQYLKIGIDKTSGDKEKEAWEWIEKKISDFQSKKVS